MPNVLMVSPRFVQNSFWSLQAFADAYGARAQSPPLGLMTVAALLPSDWSVRLIDRNTGKVDRSDLDWADMLMTGGMLPQRADMLAVIDLAQRHGKPVVVGGSDPMSEPGIYTRADFRVLGEAEGLIGQFIDAWNNGARRGTFEAQKFQADVTTSPVPRFDLIEFQRYTYIGVQFSRGCPFNCEFCDIIELYGRMPRSKTNEQMLTELDVLHRAGYRGHVNFVDDNLIGNKKALKRFLPALAAWQRRHGYPFQFSTEASMNLADDAQLLAMLRDANFFGVFIGIESPDTETLIAMQKKQNTRRDLVESVHRIYSAGIVIAGGFVIGFDSERGSVAEEIIACIDAMHVPIAMVGLLSALSNTQLTRRLERERRMLPMSWEDGDDQFMMALNFVTRRPRRDILADYGRVLAAIYAPEAFFARLKAVCSALRPPGHPAKFELWLNLHYLRFFLRVMWQATVVLPNMRRPFWSTLAATAWHNPATLRYFLFHTAFYLHLGPFARYVVGELDRQIAGCTEAPTPFAHASLADLPAA